MKTTPTFLVAMQARVDLARLQTEMYDLQRQTASGHTASDLKGYGSGAGAIVSARAAIAQGAARIDAANRLTTRLDIQDAALGHAASAVAQLKQDIMTALSSDNGTYLSGQLDSAMQFATDALNTQHDGVYVFAGDRRGAPAVSTSDLALLPTALYNNTLFSDSERAATLDLGFGGPVPVAENVSDFAQSLYTAFSDLHTLLGESPGSPLTDSQRTRLIAIVSGVETAHQDVLDAQGRNGDVQKRVERGVTRISAQNDLIAKHLGESADADLAEVAMKLAAAQTQYQAAAKVFSQIKDMSLINFLN